MALLLLLASLPAATSAQTAAELASKYVEAKGGRAALDAVQTVHMTGTLTLQIGLDKTQGPIVLDLAPPGHKARTQFTLAGVTVTTTYDGAKGWRTTTIAGKAKAKSEIQELTGDSLAAIKRTADFQGPLFEPTARGRRLELLEKSTLADTPVYVLKVTENDGTASNVFLSADSYLVLKEQKLREDGGVAAQTRLDDFRKVGGVLFPYSVESSSLTDGKDAAAALWMRIVWKEIELDVDVAASTFERPHPAAQP
jgi:hypothetical protein